MRKAQGERGQPFSSSVRPLVKKKKKKKLTTRVLEVSDSVPALPSIFAPLPLIPVSPDNLASNLGGESDPLQFDLDPSRREANPPVFESEPLSIDVIYEPEPEAEEEMAVDLTAGFGARMHKRLHEPIDVVASSTKKSCLEKARDQSVE